MRVFAVQIFPLWDLMKSWGNPQYWGWSTEKGGKMRKDKGNGGRSIWINNFKTLYVKEVKEFVSECKRSWMPPSATAATQSAAQSCVRKIVCDKVVCDKVVCVTKLCVCDKVVCNELVCGRVLCDKVVCVWKIVCGEVVCGRVVTKLCVCVTKLCVKECVWWSCVWKSSCLWQSW